MSTATLQVRKRSGKITDYSRQKVSQAVRLCLVNGCSKPNNDNTGKLADKVTDRVERFIKKAAGPTTVEQIQDLVEEVLMGIGEHEAARQYILYRAEHQKLRDEIGEPIDEATRAKFLEAATYFNGTNNVLQMTQSLDKFARFRTDLGGPARREVWPETVDRVVDWFKSETEMRGAGLSPSIWQRLHRGLLTQTSSPSMRSVQLAGAALTRCNSGVNNCTYTEIDSPTAMAEDLYLLCQGCGVGFSVEQHVIDNWPRVKRQLGKPPVTIVVPDTTEGWCDTLRDSVQYWLDGYDVKHDVSQVRLEGAPLKTKGGYASGPQPLIDLLNFARSKILAKQGQCLVSLDIHDITCFVHRIVQMGGVRRASGISLSDLTDSFMRDCKSGTFWVNNGQRNQANNSVAYNEKPTMAQFMAEWTSLVTGKSGERGIFNRVAVANTLPDRRRAALTVDDIKHMGTNPCQPADATVLTRKGIATFGELEVGTEIWTGKQWSKVTRKLYTGVKPVFRYQTVAGFFLGTENHRVVSEGTKIEARHAATIDRCPGDVSRYYVRERSKHDVLAGLLIGDGSVHKASNDLIVLHCGMKDGDIVKWGGDMFEHRPGISATAYQLTDKCESPVQPDDLPVTYMRQVPPQYKYGSSQVVCDFLRGLYSANGSICDNRITLKGASFQVITDTQEMLSSVGIPSYYTTNKPTNVQFVNGVYKCKQSYDLNITTGKGRFVQMIGFIQQYKMERATEAAEHEGASRKSSFEIINVQPLGNKPVWDITVDAEEHTYWTGGLLVSNCGEIVGLRKFFCNLSMAIVRPGDSLNDIESNVEEATIWGTLQSMMTRYNYLRDDWRINSERERLLGVDLLGHFDHPVLGARNPTASRSEALRHLRDFAVHTNAKYAEMLGINQSMAVTCNKPSGDSSVFYDTAAGFKAHHGKYFIRRLRFQPTNPIARLLKDSGVKHHVDYDRSGLLVFEFPCIAPVDNPVVLGEQSALEQLEHWKDFKLNWTEHNPSTTVFVRDSEWLKVGAWVYENWDIVGGLSFFPFDDSVYPLAPYETISAEEYEQRKEAFPVIDWAKMVRYEVRDMTELKQHMACAGDACVI